MSKSHIKSLVVAPDKYGQQKTYWPFMMQRTIERLIVADIIPSGSHCIAPSPKDSLEAARKNI